MSGLVLIGLIVVVWLVVLAPLLLRGQKPIRKAGEAFDETRIIMEGGSSVPVRRRPRLLGEEMDEENHEVKHPEDDDGEYEIVDSPSIFRHRREDEAEEDTPDSEYPDAHEADPYATARVAAAESDDRVVTELPVAEDEQDLDTVTTTELVAVDDIDEDLPDTTLEEAPVVEVIAEWNEEDHYPMDDSYNKPLDFMHQEERARAAAEYQASRDQAGAEAAEHTADEDPDSAELTQADVEFAQRRRGRGYYDPEADREFAQSQYIRRQRTLLGLGAAVLITVILGFVFGGGLWALPAVAVAMTAIYLVALRSQVRAENELRARRIRRLRRSRMGVRHPEDLPQRLRRPGAVVLELDDESPDFEGLDTTYLPVEQYEDPHRTRRVS